MDINKKRDKLETDPDFRDLFTKAKERVSQMSVKVIEIDDSILQTLFEVYAAISLQKPYNNFDTH